MLIYFIKADGAGIQLAYYKIITRFSHTKEELDKQLSNSTHYIKEHFVPFCGCRH